VASPFLLHFILIKQVYSHRRLDLNIPPLMFFNRDYFQLKKSVPSHHLKLDERFSLIYFCSDKWLFFSFFFKFLSNLMMYSRYKRHLYFVVFLKPYWILVFREIQTYPPHPKRCPLILCKKHVAFYLKVINSIINWNLSTSTRFLFSKYRKISRSQQSNVQ